MKKSRKYSKGISRTPRKIESVFTRHLLGIPSSVESRVPSRKNIRGIFLEALLDVREHAVRLQHFVSECTCCAISITLCPVFFSLVMTVTWHKYQASCTPWHLFALPRSRIPIRFSALRVSILIVREWSTTSETNFTTDRMPPPPRRHPKNVRSLIGYRISIDDRLRHRDN